MDWRRRMRDDWDRRARQDAEHFIYTRDSATDATDFDQSGEANYGQLVRPFLPLLLNGKPAHEARVVEIGCGVGRMTRWFARDFGQIEALDVSPEMLAGARRRLGDCPNVAFHLGGGGDLAPIAGCSADLVFSYIVFQHIPSREAIEGYVREAARVLKDGGAFKFQLNGDQSPAYLAHERDTWLGETFSEAEAEAMLTGAGFSLVAREGAGTQYFVLTARKGALPGVEPYVLAGEPRFAHRLGEGFGEAVDGSWRPLGARARVRLEGAGTRLYAGLYFWPESCRHTFTLGETHFEIAAPGDHFFECAGTAGPIDLAITPAPVRRPAFRVLGLY